jgi:aspartate ammonia-lyase
VKSGRTHLQDAMPIRLGQEFHAYAGSIDRGLRRVTEAADYLRDLGIGGSAVGTGVNVEPEYPEKMLKHLRAMTRLDLRAGKDRVQLMQSMGDAAGFSAQLRVLALDVSKISSDLRLMASGPRTGLDEIRLPAVQPGSSIMPGKINPSIPEMVNQVCFQVIGNDACVAVAAEHGQLELNVMMPVIAYNVLLSMQILTTSCAVFTDRCIAGIEANREMARAVGGARNGARAPDRLCRRRRAQQTVGQGKHPDPRSGDPGAGPSPGSDRRRAGLAEDDRNRGSRRQARRGRGRLTLFRHSAPPIV